MKFTTKCVPMGALPYSDLNSVARMSAKLFENAIFLPYLPKLHFYDNVFHRTIEGMPGVKFEGKKVTFEFNLERSKARLVKLDKIYNSPTSKLLEPFKFTSMYFDRFLDELAKSKSQFAYVNLVGPFTVSQKLMGLSSEQFLKEKSYRKYFIQYITLRALWIVEQIKKANPKVTPVIMLEEEMLSILGTLKKEIEEITPELISTMLSRVVEKLKEAGALVGVHCVKKCDWTVPINAGVDIISYDAYNNPNNLCIFKEQIKKFIARGGKINWCIMPTMTEGVVKEMSIDALTSRLVATMEGLVSEGVSPKYVYNSALISVQGNMDHLSIILGEKALILLSQLDRRVPVVS